MNLGQQLEEIHENTTAILRSLSSDRCKHAVCHPDGPCNCPKPDEAADHLVVRPVGGAIVAASLMALRDRMKRVPEEYAQIRHDGVLIVCACRRAHRMGSVGFHECACGRVFCFTGRRLYAMRP